jgi:SSS family solute:Na+ symporter
MVVGVLSTTAWEVIKPYDVMGAVVAVPLAIVTLIVVTLFTTRKSAGPEGPVA